MYRAISGRKRTPPATGLDPQPPSMLAALPITGSAALTRWHFGTAIDIMATSILGVFCERAFVRGGNGRGRSAGRGLFLTASGLDLYPVDSDDADQLATPQVTPDFYLQYNPVRAHKMEVTNVQSEHDPSSRCCDLSRLPLILCRPAVYNLGKSHFFVCSHRRTRRVLPEGTCRTRLRYARLTCNIALHQVDLRDAASHVSASNLASEDTKVRCDSAAIALSQRRNQFEQHEQAAASTQQ